MIRPDRRRVLAGAAAFAALAPGWSARAQTGPEVASGDDIRLTVGHGMRSAGGRTGHAVTINGLTPGPLIRLREGRTARIHVANALAEDTSIHWHGLLVPPHMDGVPGVSFPGIRPGATFTYEFPLIQSGTYWYHSHSGLQEQEGHYGPLIVDPAGADPIAADREHVLILADFTTLHPHEVFRRLKARPGVFNRQRQTLSGLLAGRDQPLSERAAWGRMRMDPADISDVTGAAYVFLVNGRGPEAPWSGLFAPGERVRLRVINAAAQTIFNLRVPGLAMSVVAADGQAVKPVAVDELQIGNAETYDVIVRPDADQAYAVVAEAVDRSGLALAVLAPRPGMTPPVPPLRRRPLTTMRDMGMDMGGMDMSGMEGHAGHSMSMRDPAAAPQVRMGPAVQMIAPMPVDRTGEPGQGLADAGHRVLTYRDLEALEPNPDVRPPSREIEIHLTGNMERFVWGFDGLKYAENAPPYRIAPGERVRVTLVNDTMMTHPIHLHGHFFELAGGPEGRKARKHTVNVLPGGKAAFDVTGIAGDWAFHCHMLYHMHAGMFRVFKVAPEGAA